MTGLIVLLVILGIFLVLGILPLKVLAEYGEAGPKALLKAGPVTILLYPRPEKPEGQQKEKKKKEREDTHKEKSSVPRGGKISFFRQLLSVALELLGKLWRKLHLEELTLHLTIAAGDGDPADTALRYGRAWAAVGAMIPLIENALIVHKRDVQVYMDAQSEEMTVYAKGVLRIRLGGVLYLGLRYGFKALRLFIQYKRKGGKQYGTSNQ